MTIQSPIIRKEGIKVVSGYGRRYRIHKGEQITEDHWALDLRTYRLKPGGFIRTWSPLPIVACENCKVLRIHRDSAGNGVIAVKPLESADWIDEILYVHLKIEKAKFKVGDILAGGTPFPHSEIAGQSDEHHLHLSMNRSGSRINPLHYFNFNELKIDS